MKGKLTAAPAGPEACAAFMDAYLEAPEGADVALRLAFAADDGGAVRASAEPLIVAECGGVSVALSLAEAAGLAFVVMLAAKAMATRTSPDNFVHLAAQLDSAIDSVTALLTPAPMAKPN